MSDQSELPLLDLRDNPVTQLPERFPSWPHFRVDLEGCPVFTPPGYLRKWSFKVKQTRVPGGVVTKPLGDDTILDWIRQLHRTSVITASVCTGAFLLAKAGLLDGLATTTHWENIAALRAAAPDTEVREGVPFVEQGRIITSAGISAGIEMSLHIVGRLAGEGLAQRTARQMAYKC